MSLPIMMLGNRALDGNLHADGFLGNTGNFLQTAATSAFIPVSIVVPINVLGRTFATVSVGYAALR